MSDKILQMFFDIGRWTKAIEKGVGKDIRKDQLIRLADERTLLAMADTEPEEVMDALDDAIYAMAAAVRAAGEVDTE